MDLCGQKRNHPTNNAKLKTNRGELTIAGKQCGDEFHIAQRRHGSHLCPHLLREEFAELSAQSVYRLNHQVAKAVKMPLVSTFSLLLLLCCL